MKKISFLLFAFAISVAAAATTITDNDTITNHKLGMNDVYDFVKKCGHYFIATVDGDQPHVRPFGTVAIFEGRLYIQTGKHKNVSKQLLSNPKIEICALNLKENVWVRIEAQAIEDDRREAKQYVLDEYPSLKSMYSADDDKTQVFYLKDATATFWSFTGEPKVVKF
jgi:uncharacterized pyridoxamine 5'-phosphate oxidase family protein